MDFKNAKEIIGSFKKRPITTLVILSVLLILFIAAMYFGGYFGEKGKQLAGPGQEIRGLSPPPKVGKQPVESTNQPSNKGQEFSTPSKVVQEQAQKNNQSDITSKANQHTEGKESPAIVQETKGGQSPAVYVGPGGSSTINYGAPKDKKTKE